jgi:hypothetical protein
VQPRVERPRVREKDGRRIRVSEAKQDGRHAHGRIGRAIVEKHSRIRRRAIGADGRPFQA